MKTFDGMAAFAQHLLTVAVAEQAAVKVSLEQGARLIERRAKEKIGTYQEQAGPFVAWAELAEATKADRVRQGFAEDEPLLRTGDLRDSIEHQVGEKEAQIGSNRDKAVYQELGTQHIPPRSFLGGAAAESAAKICEITGRNAVLALVGAEVVDGRLPIEGLNV